MSFETEARVAELMRKIEQKIELATQNPEAVVYGQFKGTSPSGAITAWVDSIGRVEQVSLAPGSAKEGIEGFLADEFLAAISNAKTAAENLKMEDEDENGPNQRRTPSQESADWQDDDGWNESGSFLR